MEAAPTNKRIKNADMALGMKDTTENGDAKEEGKENEHFRGHPASAGDNSLLLPNRRRSPPRAPHRFPRRHEGELGEKREADGNS